MVGLQTKAEAVIAIAMSVSLSLTNHLDQRSGPRSLNTKIWEHSDDYGGGGGGGYGDDYGGYGEDGYGEGGGGGSDEPNFTILDDITSVNKVRAPFLK